jgi:hypothetical protein
MRDSGHSEAVSSVVKELKRLELHAPNTVAHEFARMQLTEEGFLQRVRKLKPRCGDSSRAGDVVAAEELPDRFTFQGRFVRRNALNFFRKNIAVAREFGLADKGDAYIVADALCRSGTFITADVTSIIRKIEDAFPGGGGSRTLNIVAQQCFIPGEPLVPVPMTVSVQLSHLKPSGRGLYRLTVDKKHLILIDALAAAGVR